MITYPPEIGRGGPASLQGQSVVGQQVSTVWWQGTWEVTQGWGPTDYDGEPEGHGYSHWHAGADVGLPCGTVISLPHGVTATARWLDNPGGYGTALRLEEPNGQGVDILFGHLRQRLVADGQQLRGGEQLAVSNNTGNSSGCHVHFEVRPHGGAYGTDTDPTAWLLDPAGATAPGGDVQLLSAGSTSSAGDQNPYNVLDPRHEIWNAEHDLTSGITKAVAQAVGMGQVALGSGMVLGGLVAVSFGLRGQDGADLQRSVRRSWGRARRQAEQGQVEEQRTQRTQERATAAQGRQEAAELAARRRNTLGAYRAGLISRQEAQRRLGEPVRPTGRRPKRVALTRARPGDFKGPGTYRLKRGSTETVQVMNPARVSRVRPNLQRDFRASAPAPASKVGADDIPF